MNPFKFSTALFLLIGAVIPLVSSRVIPGASTPLFYLVSTSTSSSANLLPLRINGGTGGFAALTGSGPIGQFYFYQGQLTALDPATNFTYQPLIASAPNSGGCTTYGPLGFGGGGSDKCAIYNSFQIQSDTENSQLGAMLVFNYVGGFYACGSGQDIWYEVTPGNPSGCSVVDLYTVPVL